MNSMHLLYDGGVTLHSPQHVLQPRQSLRLLAEDAVHAVKAGRVDRLLQTAAAHQVQP